MDIFCVEYLVTLDNNHSFCNSVESFNNLLRTIDGISLVNTNIEYKSLKIEYDVQTGVISNDNHSFFHLTFSCNGENQLNNFNKFLRLIRGVLSNIAGTHLQVIWDDIGRYYAQKAYPLIFDIENTMRKLITKFMLVNIGLEWIKETTPQEVDNSIRNKSRKTLHNYLFEVDFIQLSNFLFIEYPTANFESFIEHLRKAKDLEELDFLELQNLIPRSNWERYFSTIVDCEGAFLKKRWEKLYERRIQVAHNKSLLKTEFEEVEKLVGELQPKLQKALDNLDKIHISEEEREEVAEISSQLGNIDPSKSVASLFLVNPLMIAEKFILAAKKAQENNLFLDKALQEKMLSNTFQNLQAAQKAEQNFLEKMKQDFEAAKKAEQSLLEKMKQDCEAAKKAEQSLLERMKQDCEAAKKAEQSLLERMNQNFRSAEQVTQNLCQKDKNEEDNE